MTASSSLHDGKLKRAHAFKRGRKLQFAMLHTDGFTGCMLSWEYLIVEVEDGLR
jgi:hypothetical protein